MSTTSTPVPPVPDQLTLEQKIYQAVAEAAQIAEAFNPAVSQVIKRGVAIEPVISGYVKLIAGLFHHHVKSAVAPAAPPAPPAQ